jgi:hypothetical protein
MALVGALRAGTTASSPAVRSLLVVIADDGWYETDQTASTATA